MQFRTTFQIPESNFKINHQHKILTIGSCFSDEIGGRLVDLKFEGLNNPFGVIFNAKSIQNLIERSINQKYFTIEDVHQNGEQFFCFDVHSCFNSLAENEILDKLNSTIGLVHQQIISCDVILLTLGTSWVYERKENKNIVANCHKINANQFDKKLLTTDENLLFLEQIVNRLIKINPNLKIITTVSPVRHIKDGFIENNVSKARLLDALFQLKNKYNQVDYFPAYELILDDLRDYRFFKTDMIHPSNQAIEYVWEKFSETYFNEETQLVNQKINKINLAINHRSFNEESESYQKFILKTIQMIDDLEFKHQVVLKNEKDLLQSKIK